ncbi:MAG: hypothetical protein QOG38_1440 [Hyphomicrobiales bacterium]|nr:hypothetical protein [Hyphomicrobiales bacterium]
MLIVCPSCATSYQVGPAALGPSGRAVRCARCKNMWHATPSEALVEAAPKLTIVTPHGTRDFFSGPAADEAPGHPGDILDERETDIASVEAPPIAPDHLPEAAQIRDLKVDPGTPASIETVAARRAARPRAERRNRRGILRRLANAPMLIAASLAALIALIGWRDKVVRQVPQTASLFAAVGLPVNLRGLSFENVTSSTEISDGMPVLIVEGTIVNLTRKPLEVPRLRFALRNNAGHEVYAWTAQPPKPTVGSGNGLVFRTRLASPPPDGRDVIVRFFNRRDVTAGLQ